jgi:uncharacterized DUF497 family protein
MRIDWDPAKAAANLQAHGVSFGEAATVLEDDWALTREDPESQGEQRFASKDFV